MESSVDSDGDVSVIDGKDSSVNSRSEGRPIRPVAEVKGENKEEPVIEPTPEDEKICRICMDNEVNGMIAPCRCNGSAKYVHRECLDRWRNEHPDGPSFKRCGTCNFEYILDQPNANTPEGRSKERRYKAYVIFDIIIFVVIFIIVLICLILLLYYVDRGSAFKKTGNVITYVMCAIGVMAVILWLIGMSANGNIPQVYTNMLVLTSWIPFGGLISVICCGIIYSFKCIHTYGNRKMRNRREQIYERSDSEMAIVRDFNGRENEIPPPVPTRRQYLPNVVLQ